MTDMYKKIKKQNGEAFARGLRDYHNGLFEIADIDAIVRHAGREAAPLLPYLMELLEAQNKAADESPASPLEDPFVLLERAGYDAFYADTLAAQNSIRKYFQPGELLCTFNDAARYKNYHIVHAVRHDAATIDRADFRGREERQDAYGTSVISIQMLKSGGFISIKNRYNHAVAGCDNTFDSNPDNIIPGLSTALRAHFDVAFTAKKSALSDEFVVQGGRIFRYYHEMNNIYYGDQAWARDGVIHEADRVAGDALFGKFLFDNKSKRLQPVDPENQDSFAADFNRCYDGRKHGLSVQGGNLTLDGQVLIRAERSRIRAMFLPGLTEMGNGCLWRGIDGLERFEAPDLMTMGDFSLDFTGALTEFNAPVLREMGDHCFHHASALTEFNAPVLREMGDHCLYHTPALTAFNAPALEEMEGSCLYYADALARFNAPALREMGDYCLYRASLQMWFKARGTVVINKALGSLRL